MLKHFQFIPFFIAFIFGLFAITWRKPDADQKIPKWPHPSNVGKITYRDRNGLCYKYSAKEVACDQVKAKLKPYPYQ
jgi:hypothetical protein